MAKKITPEQVAEMIKLYSEIKTYSGVAKKMGISPGTVSRYIKQNLSLAQTHSKIFSFLDNQPTIKIKSLAEVVPFFEKNIGNLQDFLRILPEEQEEYNKLKGITNE